MIPKITKGSRVQGLLRYLWGPGKSEEHTDPHIVSGYLPVDQFDAAPQLDGIPDLKALAARLEAPLADMKKPPKKHVWQCSLSLPSDEGQLSDETWDQIAQRFVAEMGLDPCRWLAVRHGLSSNDNDHIHLVVVLAGEQGQKVRVHQDFRRAQKVADRLEDEFGLLKRSPGRHKATKRPAETKAEHEISRRDGTPIPRVELRRLVRAATAGTTSEEEWLRHLAQAGVRVRPRLDEAGAVVGYAVALPAASTTDEPRWFAGSNLDGELSLPQLRKRWFSSSLSAQEWQQVTSARSDESSSSLTRDHRSALWSSATETLNRVATELQSLPAGDPGWEPAAQACADVFVQTSINVEVERTGELSQAADTLVRACAPSRQRPPASADRLVRQLGMVANQVRQAGPARSDHERSLLLAVVIAAAQLAVVVTLWRQSQRDRAAAAMAASASRQLQPIIRQSRDQIPVHAPAKAAHSRDSERSEAPGVMTTDQPTLPLEFE